MSVTELSKRVKALEAEVASLKQLVVASQHKNWQATLGMFANDPVFDEIVRLGKEYRKKANRKKS